MSAVLERVDAYLDLPEAVSRRRILEKWEALLWGREQVVRIDEAGSWVEGTVIGLSLEGALRIRARSGVIHQVSVGDLSRAI